MRHQNGRMNSLPQVHKTRLRGLHRQSAGGVRAGGLRVSVAANSFARHAFTLIELLVVMVISVILFGLIFGPMIQSFNLTNRARTQIESQTGARDVMNLLTKELSDAVYVYDNANAPIDLWLPTYTPTGGAGSYASPTNFAMLEYIKPARQQDQVPGSIPIDPTTGLPIYSGTSPSSGFSFPLTPGRALVRLFLGLHNNASAATNLLDPYMHSLHGMPQHPYQNVFEDRGQAYYTAGQPDNRYILYRAEVTVYVPNTGPFAAGGGTPTQYAVDLRLFHTVKP